MLVQIVLKFLRALAGDPGMFVGSQIQLQYLPIYILAVFVGGVGEVLFERYRVC